MSDPADSSSPDIPPVKIDPEIAQGAYATGCVIHRHPSRCDTGSFKAGTQRIPGKFQTIRETPPLGRSSAGE